MPLLRRFAAALFYALFVALQKIAFAFWLIAAFMIINDRAGFINLRDVLDVGREYIPTGRSAAASQGSACLPTTGTVSGLVFAQDANAAIAALLSSNSGASAPANDCSAAAVKGQVWLDTATNLLKQFDGTSWVTIGYVDGTNHIWTPPVGGGIGALASAGTTDLGSVPQAYVVVSGTTTITGFGSSAVTGTVHWVRFTGALTLTYNATSMILPAAVDLPIAAGDQLALLALGGGNWQALTVTKADGTPVVSPAVPVATKLDFAGFTAPAKYVFGSGQAISRAVYPDYLAAVTSTQSVTRTSGSAVLTGFADISQFGAGMPVEGTGIPAATTLLSCTGSSCTLSANATSSGTGNVVIFAHGYGAGGDTTTVGVIDCRGRATVGRDNQNGTAANRVTVAGGNFNGSILGASGGAQNHTLTAGESAALTYTTTVSPTFGGSAANIWFLGTTGGGSTGGYSAGNQAPHNFSEVGWTNTTTSNAGGLAHSILPPALVTNCMVRVLQ